MHCACAHSPCPDPPEQSVRLKATGGRRIGFRMKGHRVSKITTAIGERAGVPEIHPHAFRHSSGVQVLRLSGGNLRAVQEHLRHADIQTTTVYTKLTQSHLQEVISTFDTHRANENRDSRPAPPRHVNSRAKTPAISEWWPQGDPHGSGPRAYL